MIYKQNNSLQVSSGPDIVFQLRRVTQTESEHKNLLSSCHMTHLMAAFQNKPCLTVHHLRVFKKVLYLALLRLMDYRKRQQSWLAQVCGL